METEDNEAYYDAEIAPALAQLADKCAERGMSFLAQVEYKPEEYGLTTKFADEHSLAMIMLYLCAMSKNNIDAYVINLLRHLNRENIPFGHSMILRRFSGKPD